MSSPSFTEALYVGHRNLKDLKGRVHDSPHIFPLQRIWLLVIGMEEGVLDTTERCENSLTKALAPSTGSVSAETRPGAPWGWASSVTWVDQHWNEFQLSLHPRSYPVSACDRWLSFESIDGFFSLTDSMTNQKVKELLSHLLKVPVSDLLLAYESPIAMAGH